MKAKPNEEFDPKALREVWEWKDSIEQEVKHLPQREALHEIMRMAHEVAMSEGFQSRRDAGPVPGGTTTNLDQDNVTM